MSTEDLEIELARERGRETNAVSHALAITVPEALAYKSAGNIPDELGRSLRLVLRIHNAQELDELDSKRRAYEPDYLEAPTWRRTGSVPVTVVPLRGVGVEGIEPRAWWDRPRLAQLEAEWATTGKVAGVVVPASYRGFVYKTVLALRAAGHSVTVDTISASIARWTQPSEADEIRRALEKANGTATNL